MIDRRPVECPIRIGCGAAKDAVAGGNHEKQIALSGEGCDHTLQPVVGWLPTGSAIRRAPEQACGHTLPQFSRFCGDGIKVIAIGKQIVNEIVTRRRRGRIDQCPRALFRIVGDAQGHALTGAQRWRGIVREGEVDRVTVAGRAALFQVFKGPGIFATEKCGRQRGGWKGGFQLRLPSSDCALRCFVAD